MPEWNISFLLDHFLYAAEIARKVKEDPDVVIKRDRTPVTSADRNIELYLTRIFGDGNVLGEETFESHDRAVLTDKLYHGRIWIVDPIDGTANFVNKRSTWAISIGLAEGGVIREGAVFMPETGDFMCSDNGKTYLAQTGVRYPDKETILAHLKTAEEPDRHFNDASCINLSQVMTKHGVIRGVNPVVTVGSCVASGVDLALGRDAVYVTSAKLWDLAGMLPCLRNLGFVSANRSGENLIHGEIVDKIFQLDLNMHSPYALREPNWIGVSEKAVHSVMELCCIEGEI